MAKYDELKRQWESLEQPKFNNDPKLSLGQRILDLLSKHGPKLAQVIELILIVIEFNLLVKFEFVVDQRRYWDAPHIQWITHANNPSCTKSTKNGI